MKEQRIPVVSVPQFVLATRDSGYRSTSLAIAELIDNSIEADATSIEIRVENTSSDMTTITIKDDGKGMSPEVMACALQFGGSSRFGSRSGSGRYGMGLPNSSLSQARRVDIYSWQSPKRIWWSYLDIDEILSNNEMTLPEVKPLKDVITDSKQKSGTIVCWSKCDRLEYKRLSLLLSRLSYDLGRIFRFYIWNGISIFINGQKVTAQDPLFIQNHCGVSGAEEFGTVLQYKVAVPLSSLEKKESVIEVRFTEIPVERYHELSNEDKNLTGIAKGAGVSIIRNGREVSTGWLFMGSKRKENYDDWWRCEIRFEPVLDELFGITHNKQTIKPTQAIVEILSPDIEQISKVLNSRVRQKFIQIKKNNESLLTKSSSIALSKDAILDPLEYMGGRQNKIISRLAYNFQISATDQRSFFTPELGGQKLTVILNSDHPFFESIYSPLMQLESYESKLFKRHLELLLFASARTELSLTDRGEKDVSEYIREKWSDILAAYLR